MKLNGIQRPLFPVMPRMDGNDAEAARREILACFYATQDCYEQLFKMLKVDAGFFKKSIPLRHTLIFYFGHTAHSLSINSCWQAC